MIENNMLLSVHSKHRLPKDVTPRHYAITLRPDFQTNTFTGGEVIDIKVKRQVSQISLNAKDVTITQAYVTDDSGTRVNGIVSTDDEHELAVIQFGGGTVGKGHWQLHLSFHGEVNDKLHGMYRSSYIAPDGKRRKVFSTQFEPCDARRFFPCFDEPAFKGCYTTTLVVDPDVMAFSNAAVFQERIVEESKELAVDYGNGLRYVVAPARRKKIVEFKTTMKMSTYLTAFAAGDFETTATINVNGTPLRVICPRGKLHMTSLALKAAQFALSWFEKAFGIKYPFGKLDLLAVPEFAFGAMEHPGLITFKDPALLVDEKTATLAEIMRVFYTVAHEIAHQWFGNLVTMEWWDDLWLNEAFATLMGYIVTDAYAPHWDQWTAVSIARANAMRIDGLLSSRAVQGKVVKARDATGAFDAITYRKGASILRQLMAYIGWIPFRNGVRKYLRDHAWGNTVGKDLWQALDEISGQPVSEIMDAWINQPGHPIISLGETDVSGCVTLSQRPFKYLGGEADADTVWQVPVKLRYASSEGIQTLWVLLTEREQTVYLGEDVDWVVANADALGFYRVQYSQALMSKLTSKVQCRLSAAERFNLLNDAWACTQAGLQSAADYIEVVRLFGGETDPNVWSLIASTLGRLHRMLPDAKRFESFVRELGQPTIERLGYAQKAGESLQDAQVRGVVVHLLGTTGADQSVQAKARELFDAYRANPQSVAPELVPHVIKLAAHTGDAQLYRQMSQALAAATTPQETIRYLSGLSSFRNSNELLDATLSGLLNGSVRKQDACPLLAQLLANPVTSRKTWRFIRDNWDYVINNFPVNNLATLVEALAHFDGPAVAADVERFLKEHKVPGGDKTVEQTLETLRINVRLHEREAQPMRTLFAAESQATTTS